MVRHLSSLQGPSSCLRVTVDSPELVEARVLVDIVVPSVAVTRRRKTNGDQKKRSKPDLVITVYSPSVAELLLCRCWSVLVLLLVLSEVFKTGRAPCKSLVAG